MITPRSRPAVQHRRSCHGDVCRPPHGARPEPRCCSARPPIPIPRGCCASSPANYRAGAELVPIPGRPPSLLAQHRAGCVVRAALRQRHGRSARRSRRRCASTATAWRRCAGSMPRRSASESPVASVAPAAAPSSRRDRGEGRGRPAELWRQRSARGSRPARGAQGHRSSSCVAARRSASSAKAAAASPRWRASSPASSPMTARPRESMLGQDIANARSRPVAGAAPAGAAGLPESVRRAQPAPPGRRHHRRPVPHPRRRERRRPQARGAAPDGARRAQSRALQPLSVANSPAASASASASRGRSRSIPRSSSSTSRSRRSTSRSRRRCSI